MNTMNTDAVVAAPPIRTLIADDATVIVATLGDLLSRQERVQVVGTAADGAEVIRLAGELQPDLVLMDLHMPGLNGLTATAAVKALVPGARIIVITVEDTIEMAAAAMDWGADGFIGKSRLLHDLPEEMERLFSTT